MTTLAEYASEATFRLNIFGRAKVGKTALALALAKIWKLHYFDLEGGVKTGLRTLDKGYWGNVNLFPITTRQSAPLGAETLLKIITGAERRICYYHGKVECHACLKAEAPINTICLDKLGRDDCLVIDSTTQLSMDVNTAVLPFIFKQDTVDPEAFVLGKDTGGKDFKYPMAVSFILDRIFSYLQTAKHFNVIAISHEVMTETLKDTGKVVKGGENQPGTGEEKIFPAAGSRNFSRQFGRYFDALIHVDVVNGKHKAFSSTAYSSKISTGSRLLMDIESIKDVKGEVLPPEQAIVKLVELSRSAGK